MFFLFEISLSMTIQTTFPVSSKFEILVFVNTLTSSLASGLLWPDALIQLNPAFQPGGTIDELVDEGLLHKTCKDIFRRKSEQNPFGDSLRLHKHQEDAIRTPVSARITS
jgi:hypothetical protein